MKPLAQLIDSLVSHVDFLLLLPMALVGVVLMAAVPCRTRIAHYVLEGVGAAVGALFAVVMMGSLSRIL